MYIIIFLIFFMFSFVLILMSESPLPLAAFVTISSAMIAMISGISFSMWSMIAILLIFLGGMMVMFLYMCTLSMNNKLKMPKFSLKYMFFLISMCLLMMINLNYTMKIKQQLEISELYNSAWGPMISMLIIYLMTTLLIVVKISESFKGAISKNWL